MVTRDGTLVASLENMAVESVSLYRNSLYIFILTWTSESLELPVWKGKLPKRMMHRKYVFSFHSPLGLCWNFQLENADSRMSSKPITKQAIHKQTNEHENRQWRMWKKSNYFRKWNDDRATAEDGDVSDWKIEINGNARMRTRYAS